MTVEESIGSISSRTMDRYIAKIERLHAVNAELLAAAKGAVDLLDRKYGGPASDFDERLAALQAAIAKAEESAP